MRRIKHGLWYSVACLLFTAGAAAQSRHFLFTHYSIASGLNSNKIYFTHQDAAGYIWIAGADGLQRFDGSHFITYTDREGRMPNAALTHIATLSSNELLLNFPQTKECGILNTTTRRYTPVPIEMLEQMPPRASISFYTGDDRNIFLVGNPSPLIFKYDAARKVFSPHKQFVLPPQWKVYSMFYDQPEARYWFSCDSGLAVYDQRAGAMYTKYNNPAAIPALNERRLNEINWVFFIDSRRRQWVLNWPVYGRGGELLHCFDARSGKYLKDTAGWAASINSYRELRDIKETRGGIIWVYGLNGLLSNMPQENQFVNNREVPGVVPGPRFGITHHLMEDREGGIWVSTNQGLYYSPPYNSSVFNIHAGKLHPVNNITPVNASTLLLHTWGGGTKKLVFDGAGVKLFNLYEEVKGPENGLVMAWCGYAQPGTSKIFIGGQFGWLGIYDTLTRQTQRITDSTFDNRTIRQIAGLGNGDVLLATQYGRVVRLRKGRFETIFDCGTIIYRMLVDGKQHVWLATHDRGIFEIDGLTGRQLRQFDKTHGLGTNIVAHMEFYNDSLLVATTGTLNLLETATGRIRNIGLAQGLPGTGIQAMHFDRNGMLWMVTGKGLYRYNIFKHFFTGYSNKDGIQDVSQTGAAARLAGGMMFFAGEGGLMLAFSPESFSSRRPPSDVTITGIRINNADVPVDSLLQLPAISLPPQKNSFSFDFASLSYQQGDKLVYLYQLKGIDKQWIPLSTGRLRADYNYLPPGRYTFMVQCKTAEGLYSQHITTFQFRVRSPFYKAAWFYSMLAMVALLIFYTLHRLRLHRVLAVEGIRNRVARDLHDDMGSTLSTINILSSMAKTKLHSDVHKTGEYISKISENSQRMMEAMDDIVWSIKPANDSMQKIAARMREFATSVLEAKDMEMQFEVDEAVYDVKLNMAVRRDFFLVFKEAVNNAAKYSQAQRVHIQLRVSGGRLLLKVQDDGRGFDVKTADTGNGLGNMYKRTEAMKGSIHILSGPGAGATVQVNIPIS